MPKRNSLITNIDKRSLNVLHYFYLFCCFFLCLLVSCVSDKSHYIILLSHCLLFYVILCRLLLLNMLPYGTEWKTYARNRSHLRKHAVCSLTDWLVAWLVCVCVCVCIIFFALDPLANINRIENWKLSYAVSLCAWVYMCNWYFEFRIWNDWYWYEPKNPHRCDSYPLLLSYEQIVLSNTLQLDRNIK